ncbi:addiction module toxin RelE [Salmonella enterica subsp. enterica serovar Quebec str. S-1267]|nr:addiction module toxin RelE [Salmonella enterica subsp. enterica serovar Quebec str. S-1267]
MSYLYTHSFKLHQGGKGVNPLALTYTCDWGKRMQPTRR